MNTKKSISINDLVTLLENVHYKTYSEQKEKIKEKYNQRLFTCQSRVSDKKWFNEEGRKEWKKYLKEINELMFKPDGDFQKFSWDIMSELSKTNQERKARGKKQRQIEY